MSSALHTQGDRRAGRKPVHPARRRPPYAVLLDGDAAALPSGCEPHEIEPVPLKEPTQ